MIICQVVHQVLVQKVDHLHHRINNNMSIVCSTSNLNNIDKSTPTNYQLVFPKIPTETSIGANNPFVMNIHSAIIPPVSIAVEEHRWQGLKTKYALSPMEFDPWLVSFTVDVNLANWNLLRKWMQFINNNNDKIAEYHSEYSVDASMVITNNYGKMVKEIILVDIWPMQIGEISFSQREGDVVLESTVNFNYDYFYVRSTEWTEEFSSSSKSSSSSSKSSSSSSLSSSSSSSSSSLSSSSSSSSLSSSSSSSSSSLSSSSSSESSTFVIAGTLARNDSDTSGVSLYDTPELSDDNYCDSAIIPALGSNLQLKANTQWGLKFNSPTNIWGFDMWCATSGSPSPMTGFLNPTRSSIYELWRSDDGVAWTQIDGLGVAEAWPYFDFHARMIQLGTNEEGLIGIRFPLEWGRYTNQYFKAVFFKTLTASGTGGAESSLYPSEIKVMSGRCGPLTNRWCLGDENLANVVVSNYGRTIRTTGGAVYGQIFTSQWVNPPGKYYWEIYVDNHSNNGDSIGFYTTSRTTLRPGASPSNGGGINIDGGEDYNILHGGIARDTGWNYSPGDVMMYAVDTEAQVFWWGVNGTWFNSGNPSAGTNPIYDRDGVGSDYNFNKGTLRAGAQINVGGKFTSRFKESEQTYEAPFGFIAPVMEDDPTPKGCFVSSSSSSSSSSSVSSSSRSSSSRSSSSSSQVVGVEYIESTNAVANGTTVTIDRTALTQLQDNDFVMIHYTYYNDMDTTVIPAGFTLLFNERTTAGADSTHGVLYKYITDVSSEPTSWTFGSTSSNEKVGVATVWRNVDGADPIDSDLPVITSEGSNDATPNAPDFTTNQDAAMAITSCGLSYTSSRSITFGAPADFTMAASRGYYANDYVGCGIAYAEQRPPSASVVIGNWTNSPDDSSTEWITASFSLRRGN
jgi:hypothetical protein